MTTRYRAGELDQLVTVRRDVRTPDGHGGSTVSRELILTAYALVRPLTGGERLAADRVEATAGYLVVLRPVPGLSEADTVEWHQGGRTMNVRTVKSRGPQALYVELECDAGVAL